MTRKNRPSGDSIVDSTTVTHECRASSDAAEPGYRIVTAVAELEDCEPTALPPLFDTVDSEALNALFSGDDEWVSIRFACATAGTRSTSLRR